MLIRRIVVGLVASAVLVGAGVSAAGAAAPPKAIVRIYGDSLLKELAAPIKAGIPKAANLSVNSSAHPSKAPCDLIPTIRSYLALHAVALLVIETAGNASSNCMMTAPKSKVYLTVGSPEWLAKYEADMTTIFDLAAANGAKVLVIDPPPFSDYWQPGRNAVQTELIPALEAEAANYHGISFTRAPRDAVSVTPDVYSRTLPCLPSETAAQGCISGLILARDPVGLHFCPTGFDAKGCPEYSSGAVRFGAAMAAAIVNPPPPVAQ